MTSIERVEQAAKALKLFPLPTVVLFPGTNLPLHIFEPRYQAMVNDALAQDRVIALAQPEADADPQDPSPRLRPMACAGLIAWHEALPEGRSNIIVQGITRVRLLEELPPHHPYREAKASVLVDPEHPGEEEGMLRQALLELSSHLPGEVAQNLLQTASRSQGGLLADVIASTVVPDLERRQELLSELDVGARLRAVLADVGEVLARLSSAAPKGPLN
jgi:Lon protease-like protein